MMSLNRSFFKHEWKVCVFNVFLFWSTIVIHMNWDWLQAPTSYKDSSFGGKNPETRRMVSIVFSKMAQYYLSHRSSMSRRRCSRQRQRLQRQRRRREQAIERPAPSVEPCDCREQTNRLWVLPELHKGVPWTQFCFQGRTTARRWQSRCRGGWGSRWRWSLSSWWSASSPPSGSWSASPPPSWGSWWQGARQWERKPPHWHRQCMCQDRRARFPNYQRAPRPDRQSAPWGFPTSLPVPSPKRRRQWPEDLFLQIFPKLQNFTCINMLKKKCPIPMWTNLQRIFSFSSCPLNANFSLVSAHNMHDVSARVCLCVCVVQCWICNSSDATEWKRRSMRHQSDSMLSRLASSWRTNWGPSGTQHNERAHQVYMGLEEEEFGKTFWVTM